MLSSCASPPKSEKSKPTSGHLKVKVKTTTTTLTDTKISFATRRTCVRFVLRRGVCCVDSSKDFQPPCFRCQCSFACLTTIAKKYLIRIQLYCLHHCDTYILIFNNHEACNSWTWKRKTNIKPCTYFMIFGGPSVNSFAFIKLLQLFSGTIFVIVGMHLFFGKLMLARKFAMLLAWHFSLQHDSLEPCHCQLLRYCDTCWIEMSDCDAQLSFGHNLVRCNCSVSLSRCSSLCVVICAPSRDMPLLICWKWTINF